MSIQIKTFKINKYARRKIATLSYATTSYEISTTEPIVFNWKEDFNKRDGFKLRQGITYLSSVDFGGYPPDEVSVYAIAVNEPSDVEVRIYSDD